jgi:PAS domain S-box-containing protein
MINFIDADGRVRLVNPEWERTLGWPLTENLDIFAECYPDPGERARALAVVEGSPGEWEDFRTRVRDGRTIDTSWLVMRLSDGTRIGIGQDITERKRAQEALRSFSRRLMEVQENERRCIARELHDEVGQLLTALSLILGRSGHTPGAAALDQARQVTAELLARVRKLSLDLRPTALDDLGLLPALLGHVERYTALTGVRVAVRQRGLAGERFEPALETAVYRITQEALTNVARHSGALEARVSLDADARSLTLEIEDDGQGFDPDTALDGGTSSGLLGMRERVRLLDGRFVLTAAPGAGTRLRAELPRDAG